MKNQTAFTTQTTQGKFLRHWRQATEVFLTKPASGAPLSALRLGLASVLLIQALFVQDAFLELFGHTGFVQGTLNAYLQDTRLPDPYWLSRWIPGLSPAGATAAVGTTYVLSLVTLLLGYHARISALVAWFTHLALMNSGFTTNYGADQFANIMLFYLIWMPAAKVWALDSAAGRTSPAPSAGARLGLRVLQCHMGIVYLASGLEKASGPQWWNGDAIWRSLMLPIYQQYDFSWLAQVPWIAVLAGWGTLVVEIGYPAMMACRRTRPLWVGATLGLHVGIGLFLGLHVFAALMCVLTFSAFAVPAEADGETARSSFLQRLPSPSPRPAAVLVSGGNR